MAEKITNTPADSPVVLLDIPAQVFTSFLQALTESGAAPELIERLQVTLLKKKSFTDRTLKDAILGEDSVV